MAPPSLGGLFQIGIDILNTLRDATTKTILARTGDAYNEVSEADGVEWWQHVGFASRPSKASKNSACQGVVIRDSAHDACVASRDLRGQELAGNLDYGETCVYAAGETGTAQGRLLIKANGNVAVLTTRGNVPGGTSVTIQANADGTIYVASEYGAVTIESGALKIAHVSGAGLQLDSKGVAMLGQNLALNGSAVALGTPGGTGVLTQLSTLPFGAALTAAGVSAAAFAVAFNAFVESQDDPASKNAAKGAATALGASIAAAAVAFLLPTNVSLNVKSS